MAKLKNIVRSNPLSTFQNTAPETGTGFRLMAAGLQELYDRVEPAATEIMKDRGLQYGREQARAQFGNPSGTTPPADTLSLIREFEGFRESPYWDVNAHRVGYGSDTITAADGSVRRVQKGDRVTRDDAERDLQRRVSTEFAPIARKAIGAERFDAMTEQQKAAVTSIAYNYGEIPNRIVGALRSGDTSAAAAAIRNLGGDNDGINRGRRNREADLFASSGAVISTRNGPDEPPEMVRTSSGKLEARRYSPYSGSILAAHDAASKIGYQAEVLERGTADLLDMSNQYLLDPEGFAAAAEGYIETIVNAAPETMRGEINGLLGKEAHRRRLGIMEDRQRDIRARADNSSKALMDRWSTSYAEAIASGDPYGSAEALGQLDSILQAREALPGVAWTEEQSANVLLDAQRAADRMKASRAKEQSDGYKETFRLITEAAKDGRRAADEGLLNDPTAVAMHPELAREAAAFASLRDNLPEFLTMTPADQVAAVQRLRATEVSEGWQLDVVESAATTAKANAKAWADDPVKRAGEVLAQTETGAPPQLPELTPQEPQKFVDALKGRHEYMNGLFDAGYTDTRAYLSEDEAKSIALLMGKDTPAAVRAAMSAAIVSGFGADAVTVFGEIDADPVTMFAGKMQAVGGRADVAADILEGQAILDEELVQTPPKADRIDSFNAQLGQAFQGIPGATQIQGEIMPAAVAYYATMARGVDPSSDTAAELLSQSVQTVLGQATNKRGEVTGGIQTVGGHSTLLPVGVSGKRADAAIRSSLGGLPHGGGFAGGMANLGALWAGERPELNAEAWTAAAGSVPMINGQPIPRDFIDSGSLRIVPLYGDTYWMEVGGVQVQDGDNNLFYFDLKKLIEATE